ncbi:MAG: radical SAM protein [Pseudomonadota bacterium]|nr:radical SAM protein [Pseudomonadota bacterium]
MIVDQQGRRFRKLRVSLTAACNYACTYCVPSGKRLVRADRELSGAQLAHAVELLVAVADIRELRLTGGEPLISPMLEPFLEAVAHVPLVDKRITTNGQWLSRKLGLLTAAGVRRVNVSLDSLDPDGFRRMARGGDLPTVLAGLEAARAAGVAVKVNMVPMRHSNLDQVVPLLDYCMRNGFELRYIELMRMGHLARNPALFSREFVGMNELLECIGAHHQYERTDAPYDSTAVRFQVPGVGSFGIIPNESEPFCRACTRLRLSSEGHLYGCLSNSRYHSMRGLLDQPMLVAAAELKAMLGLAMADKQPLAFRGETTVMKLIGG